MKKIIGSIVGFVIVGIATYLFLYPYDYMVRFEVPTTVGTLNQSLKSWQLTKENIKFIPSESVNKVQQEITYGDSTHIYTWKLKPLNATTSKVILGVKDKKNSISNKLKVPFGETFIKDRSEAVAKDFYDGLKDHLDSFEVTIDGESVTPPSFAAYVTIKGTQIQKASGMMKYYGYLSQIMLKDGIEPKGPPFIEVTDWNQATDSITYNFCFPIKNKEGLPQFPEVKYKRLFEKKALKATYNGNYITSDRAWYALKAYAKEEGITLEDKPFEIFYNNPSTGANERNWKAEIFLPIKE